MVRVKINQFCGADIELPGGGSFDAAYFGLLFVWAVFWNYGEQRVCGVPWPERQGGRAFGCYGLPRGGFCVLTWVENVSIWGKYVSIFGLFFGDMLAFWG